MIFRPLRQNKKWFPVWTSFIAINLFFLVPQFNSLSAQHNLGVPPVSNHLKSTFGGGTQTWGISQDKRGVMYFANNDGLLEYNGASWNKYEVKNKTNVRSVFVHDSGKIFVGAQNELGYFFPAGNGVLKYHSLLTLLSPEDKVLEDVWDIIEFNKSIFFRTNNALYQYFEGKMQVFRSKHGISSFGIINDELVAQNEKFEIMAFRGSGFETMVADFKFNSPITGFIPWDGDTVLLTTLKDGIFFKTKNNLGPWITLYDKIIKEKRIYDAGLLSGQRIVLGTSKDGIIVIDKFRRAIFHLYKKNGLQNNNVLSVYEDREHNLWLGLDNGIDCVFLSSPSASIIPDRELQSTGYAAAVHNKVLYLGLSDGVYTIPQREYYDPFNTALYQKLPFTDGQVWGLKSVENSLLLGHHEGAFTIDLINAAALQKQAGAWTFALLDKNHLLVGGYKGIDLFKKVGPHWKFSGKINGIDESCRIMVKDQSNNIWVSHPYRGIYRLVWNTGDTIRPTITFYDVKAGLPSYLNNYVFSVRNDAVFCTEKGIYRFNAKTNRFEEDIDFNKNLGHIGRIKHLQEDEKGNIYFIADEEVGKLIVKDLGIKKEVIKIVFNDLKSKLVGGFEFVFPYDDHYVLFGAEQGFILYNTDKGNPIDTNIHVLLTKAMAGDSILYGGWFIHDKGPNVFQDKPNKFQVPYALNSLSFYLSSTNFKDLSNLLYRTQLEGLQSTWSEWSTEQKYTFTNLAAGAYTFKYQAQSLDGRISSVGSFTFNIKPPWYKSKYALSCYSFLTVLFLVSLLRRQRVKFEKEKAKLKEIHEEEQEINLQQVEDTKAALSLVQHEKLEDEIEFKNKELALATLHLVQKGKIMQSIKAALQTIIEKTNHSESKKELQSLANLLSFDAQLDEDWEQFAYHFDKVHVDFLTRLRKKYPQLTPNDDKLCAYLRMNLSIKETAQMLNISIRGVEASRYRLRKKLNLPNEANLAEIMMEV